MKELKRINWYWFIIILFFTFCIRFFSSFSITVISEILLFIYLPNFVEGKEWRFFIYD